MTNREWLLNKMQNMSDEELAKDIGFNTVRTYVMAEKCVSCTSKSCDKCIVEWLKAEHKEKITLSEAERTILENINKDYTWIVRDDNGQLKIYTQKPKKGTANWLWNIEFTKLNAFNHLFQFITWNDSEPYNIEELLKEKKTY